MYNMICVKFHSKYLTHTLKKVCNLLCRNFRGFRFKSSYEFVLKTPCCYSITARALMILCYLIIVRNMMTSSNGNIFRVTGPLCGEFTGHRWIPRQWRGAYTFSFICARINGWVNNREAGDLRLHRAHFDVIVMRQYSATGSVVEKGSRW